MKALKSIFYVFVLLCFTSCGVGEAEDIAAEFHKKLDAGDYQYIVENLVYEETLIETGEEAWYGLFEAIETRWGKATSREQDFGFESNTSNGITRVKLDYTTIFGSKTVYERIFLADKGDGFKVTGYFLDESKSALNEAAGNLN